MQNSVVIYFKNGKTALFQNVSEFNISGLTIKFKYHGESTKTDRQAQFYMTEISGYAPTCNLVD